MKFLNSRVAVLSLALGLAVVSGSQAFALMPKKAAAAKATETIVVQPDKNNTEHNVERVSRLANQVLEKIQTAKDDIDANKIDLAKMQLSQADELLANIQQTGPTAKIIDTVKTKRKELQKTEDVSLDLIPLDVQIVEMERVVPVPAARDHLAMAKKSMANKDAKGASQHLVEVENTLIYAEADLPISRTRQDVLSAESFLDKNKPEAASRALQDSLKHIMVMTAEADSERPLPPPPRADGRPVPPPPPAHERPLPPEANGKPPAQEELQSTPQKPDLSTTRKHPKVMYSLPTR